MDLIHKTQQEISVTDHDVSGDVFIGSGETDGVRLLSPAIDAEMSLIWKDR